MVAITLTLIICIFVVAYVVWLIATGRLKKGDFNIDMKKIAERLNQEINEAFGFKNNIDHCPKCGSTNIRLYRKGYNYKIGFLGAIFGVRGSGYAGGFDANHTCCRCLDCGKDWETDYDYRLINK